MWIISNTATCNNHSEIIDYLNRTEYKKSDSICPETDQKLIACLIQQILQKIPLYLLPSIDCNELLFINDTPIDKINQQLSVNINQMNWTTTGLWLQPNTPASIQLKTPMNNDNVLIQIGSHTQNLFVSDTQLSPPRQIWRSHSP